MEQRWQRKTLSYTKTTLKTLLLQKKGGTAASIVFQTFRVVVAWPMPIWRKPLGAQQQQQQQTTAPATTTTTSATSHSSSHYCFDSLCVSMPPLFVLTVFILGRRGKKERILRHFYVNKIKFYTNYTRISIGCCCCSMLHMATHVLRRDQGQSSSSSSLLLLSMISEGSNGGRRMNEITA